MMVVASHPIRVRKKVLHFADSSSLAQKQQRIVVNLSKLKLCDSDCYYYCELTSGNWLGLNCLAGVSTVNKFLLLNKKIKCNGKINLKLRKYILLSSIPRAFELKLCIE